RGGGLGLRDGLRPRSRGQRLQRIGLGDNGVWFDRMLRRDRNKPEVQLLLARPEPLGPRKKFHPVATLMRFELSKLSDERRRDLRELDAIAACLRPILIGMSLYSGTLSVVVLLEIEQV